jgi:hypothetical protein
MRFRGDFYREPFFRTTGTEETPPTSPVPTTDPSLEVDPVLTEDPVVDTGGSTEPAPVLPELQDEPTNDIATDDGTNDEVPTYTLDEIKDIIGTIKPPSYPRPKPYYVPHPYLQEYYILVNDNGGYSVPATSVPTDAEIITGGIGIGGYGGGYGGGFEEEEEYIEEPMVSEGKRLAQPDPKKKLLWIIIAGVVIYLGYKYLYKKN